MAQFGRHLDCRANNCNFVAKTQRELKKHMIAISHLWSYHHEQLER